MIFGTPAQTFNVNCIQVDKLVCNKTLLQFSQLYERFFLDNDGYLCVTNIVYYN